MTFQEVVDAELRKLYDDIPCPFCDKGKHWDYYGPHCYLDPNKVYGGIQSILHST